MNEGTVMTHAELVHAGWDGTALNLECRFTVEARGGTGSADGVHATLCLRRRNGGPGWSCPLNSAPDFGNDIDNSGASDAPRQWLASGSVEPLRAADGAALTSGVWDATVEVRAAGSMRELPIHTSNVTLAPAVVGNRPMDAYSTGHGLALDVDQTHRPLLDPVVGVGTVSAKITASTLTMHLPVHITGRGPRLEIHLVPEQPGRARHILRTILGPDSDRAGHGIARVGLPQLGSARSWAVELRLDRHGAGPTSPTDLVLVRRDRSTQLIRAALHPLRPGIAIRNDVVVLRTGEVDSFHAATWQRRLRSSAR